MITAQILGKTELFGVFKDLVENGEDYQNLSKKDKETLLGGFAANICYTERDMEDIVSKPYKEGSAIQMGIARANSCIKSGHHSVLDHQRYAIYFTGLPKILAMVLNNEKDYATSEKSARYTKMQPTKQEEATYLKWIGIIKDKILERYPNYDFAKAEKLAQENARYMISVFTPTKMLYSASLRQLNYVTAWLKNSLNNDHPIYKKLQPFTKDLVGALESLPFEQINLQKNEKNRRLSLIEHDNYVPEQFGRYYAVNYKGSFAQLAQAHRHRTIDYSLSLLEDFECYTPKIIRDDVKLVDEWNSDTKKLANNYPQGMLVNFFEGGKIEDFVLKTKERLCGHAQLEICDQTKATLNRLINGYASNIRKMQSAPTPNKRDEDYYKTMKDYLEKINKGARCTQYDYNCPAPCGNKEAISLERVI